MLYRILAAAVLLAAVLGLAYRYRASEEHPLASALAQGNSARGEVEFGRLECPACHQTVGRTDPPPSTDAVNGPILGPELADMDPLFLAGRIVGPGHELAELISGNPLSSCAPGDLTVGELADLIAYLHSLEEPSTSEFRR